MAEAASEQWGVMATRELLDRGMTYSSLSRRRRRGHLHQLYPRVWAVGHPNPPWQGWLLAAVKACGPNALLATGLQRSFGDSWIGWTVSRT